LQNGVPAEHWVSAHTPFASQVCRVPAVPGLQRTEDGVQARHWPEVQVPVSPLIEHWVVSARLEMTHALPVQVVCRHGFAGCEHCAVLMQATHVAVVASQKGLWPAQATTGSYWPLELQVSTPLPLHTLDPGAHAWQVPAALHVPPGQGLAGVFCAKPHTFPEQAAVRHGLLLAGHCVPE
jgi:hypothetical protein